MERTAQATGVNRAILWKIKIEEDIRNWSYKPGDQVYFVKKKAGPENFSWLVRQVILDIYLEKDEVP